MARHRKPADAAPAVIASGVLAGTWMLLVLGCSQTATASEGFAAPRARHDEAARYTPPRPVPPPKPLGQKAVDLALGKLGVPYVWGSKGPNTFDCSGLTGWVWRQLGVPLGPDTYTQIHQGQRVTDIQPGDLIFPSTHHVQLAISRTQVVEAPGRGMTVRLHAMPAHYIAIRPTPRRTP